MHLARSQLYTATLRMGLGPWHDASPRIHSGPRRGPSPMNHSRSRWPSRCIATAVSRPFRTDSTPNSSDTHYGEPRS